MTKQRTDRAQVIILAGMMRNVEVADDPYPNRIVRKQGVANTQSTIILKMVVIRKIVLI